VAEYLSEWLGPVVSPGQLAKIEISYRRGKTEYLNLSPGAEADLSPTMLPADLSKYDHVHVAALCDALMQLSFIQACRRRGAKRISSGTFPDDAKKHPQNVRKLVEHTDCFFMNRREAIALFGSLDAANTDPGKLLYVTLGAQGACIIQGDSSTMIPAVSTTEVDPTGAGDTFCGAALAYLLQKKHPVMAARHAVALAAEMIGQVGPSALLSEDPPPQVPLDPRVRVNAGQVRKAAKMISTLTEVAPYPFVSPELPPVGGPRALEYFFAATLQQFSFWTVQDNRYHRPLLAKIGRVERKGSDYLWYAFNRRVEQDADFCSPERQANLSREELLEVFRTDDGNDPMPALDLHLEQARRYGQDMVALQLGPRSLLQKAMTSAQPLQTFLEILDQIGGYKEDPLRKKSSLLALILKDRPEGFLSLGPDEELAPIIDYHLMRSCLRVGLVEVIDEGLKMKLLNRQVVSPEEEWAVRYPSYLANEQLIALSGKGTGAVDQFFFGARKRCPEMSDPDCGSCQLDPVCDHRKELFQPVLRTSNY
jgi:hypothetical protein